MLECFPGHDVVEAQIRVSLNSEQTKKPLHLSGRMAFLGLFGLVLWAGFLSRNLSNSFFNVVEILINSVLFASMPPKTRCWQKTTIVCAG